MARRAITLLAVVLLAVSMGGCSRKGPCDELLGLYCDAAGDAGCERMKEQVADREPTAKEREECRAILEDDERLARIRDGLRAVARIRGSGDDGGGAEESGSSGATDESKAEEGGSSSADGG